jgi:hypothetical protein
VNEIFVVQTLNYKIHQNLVCSHIIEVIKQGSKIWQKSTTKWLIVTFGLACYEVNLNQKFEAPQHNSGHVMKVIIIRRSLNRGGGYCVVGKEQEFEKILRDIAN